MPERVFNRFDVWLRGRCYNSSVLPARSLGLTWDQQKVPEPCFVDARQETVSKCKRPDTVITVAEPFFCVEGNPWITVTKRGAAEETVAQ